MKNLNKLLDEGFELDGEVHDKLHIYKHEEGETIYYNPIEDKVITRDKPY